MNAQLDLVPIHGATYSPERDEERLRGKMGQVFRLMADGVWRTSDRAAIDCQRRYGKHFKESSVARYLCLFDNPGVTGWRREERDAGGGSKEYRLVRET